MAFSFLIALLASFFVAPERKLVIWVFGAIGTLMIGLNCLHEGFKLRSNKNTIVLLHSKHYIRIALLSFACFAIFAVLYYLFSSYPHSPINIDSPDLTSLH